MGAFSRQLRMDNTEWNRSNLPSSGCVGVWVCGCGGVEGCGRSCRETVDMLQMLYSPRAICCYQTVLRTWFCIISADAHSCRTLSYEQNDPRSEPCMYVGAGLLPGTSQQGSLQDMRNRTTPHRCQFFHYLSTMFSSGNRTPGSRPYLDLVNDQADSACIHMLELKSNAVV